MWQGMTDEVGERLKGLGVEKLKISDLIEAESVRAYNYVIGICNLDMMPEILKPVCIDIACAAIIRQAAEKSLLSVSAENMALESIKEGDVTVTFDNANGQAVVERLIDRLDFNDKSLLISYRRLKW